MVVLRGGEKTSEVFSLRRHFERSDLDHSETESAMDPARERLPATPSVVSSS